MALGIVLGNTVDSVGPALQKGEFVGVSIPIGMLPHLTLKIRISACTKYAATHLPGKVSSPDLRVVVWEWCKVTGAVERYMALPPGTPPSSENAAFSATFCSSD
jgi:hypothetical protein